VSVSEGGKGKKEKRKGLWRCKASLEEGEEGKKGSRFDRWFSLGEGRLFVPLLCRKKREEETTNHSTVETEKKEGREGEKKGGLWGIRTCKKVFAMRDKKKKGEKGENVKN